MRTRSAGRATPASDADDESQLIRDEASNGGVSPSIAPAAASRPPPHAASGPGVESKTEDDPDEVEEGDAAPTPTMDAVLQQLTALVAGLQAAPGEGWERTTRRGGPRATRLATTRGGQASRTTRSPGPLPELVAMTGTLQQLATTLAERPVEPAAPRNGRRPHAARPSRRPGTRASAPSEPSDDSESSSDESGSEDARRARGRHHRADSRSSVSSSSSSEGERPRREHRAPREPRGRQGQRPTE
jgi:hypothetical protein